MACPNCAKLREASVQAMMTLQAERDKLQSDLAAAHAAITVALDKDEACKVLKFRIEELQSDLAAAIEEQHRLAGLVIECDGMRSERDSLAEQLRQVKRDSVSVDYAIALQRAIEHHCRKVPVPDNIAVECPHHAGLLNAALAAPPSAPAAKVSGK